MRFIELHRASDGRPLLINLDDVADIRPASDSDNAIVEFRSLYRNHDPMPLLTVETYRDIRGTLAAAREVSL